MRWASLGVRRGRGRWRRLGLRAAVWLIVVGTVVVSVMCRWPPWWAGERVGWWGHVGSNFQGWLVGLGVVVVSCCGVARCWAAGVAVVVGVVVSLSAVIASLPRGDGGVVGGEAGGATLRVLHFNVRGSAVDAEALLALVAAERPDVVSLVEVQRPLMARLRSERAWLEMFPGRFVPNPAWGRTVAVLSRYPVGYREEWGVPGRARGVVTVYVEVGDFEVGFSPLHPASPRTVSSTRYGDRMVEAAARVYAERFLEPGLPLIVAADLNGTALSDRGERLAEVGLRASKPLHVLGGTWPADGVAPLRVPIDDVWLGGGVRCVGWRVVEGGFGSDHLPVVVDVRLDAD